MKRINPDRPLTESERNHRFYEKHREQELARNAEYSRKNVAKIAKRARLKHFRMSQEAYDVKMAEQNNCCAVCFKPFTKTPHVDHKHDCCPGRITCGECSRGILCEDCNLGLGRFKDSIEILSNAIKYLEAYNGR